MECDPLPVAAAAAAAVTANSLNSSSSSSVGGSATNSRYNLLLSSIGTTGNGGNNTTNNNPTAQTHSHMHRMNRYPTMSAISSNNSLLGGVPNNSQTNLNLLNNYAPNSLPIELGQISVGASSDRSLLSFATTAPINTNYIPYSMSNEAINSSMPNTAVAAAAAANQMLMQTQNFPISPNVNKNLIGVSSNPSSGGTSSLSNQSNPNQTRSNGSSADRSDDSPMVGVCVQQSPVVIH